MNPIEKNATELLIILVEDKINETSGKSINELTGFEANDINDAVDYLESIGAIKVLKALRTDPYNFSRIKVTARGKYLFYEIRDELKTSKTKEEKKKDISEKLRNDETLLLPERPKNPVGSPYGFQEKDWKFVSSRKKDDKNLYVVLGLKYKSEHYNTTKLIKNLETHFKTSLKSSIEKEEIDPAKLQFEKLRAGLGGHVFNKIAKKIIGADIAVFEVSDHAPNVMIELGVALTWGIPVIPLFKNGAPELPSDISGHSWVKYDDNFNIIFDDDFQDNLKEIIRDSLQEKG